MSENTLRWMDQVQEIIPDLWKTGGHVDWVRLGEDMQALCARVYEEGRQAGTAQSHAVIVGLQDEIESWKQIAKTRKEVEAETIERAISLIQNHPGNGSRESLYTKLREMKDNPHA